MASRITRRPRTKPPEERREELMSAAERLFLEQGFEPTTIEQIAVAARVAKGTFCLYFKSKDEVRLALGQRCARDHLARIEAAVGRKPLVDWKGKLSAWAAASVSFYVDSIKLHDVLFYEGRSPTREGLVDNIVITDLADMLRGGAEAGAWSIEDARSAAVFLFSGMHGAVDDAYSREEWVNRRCLAQRLEELCLNVVRLSA
ncbi:MAG TPA: TetR/AcrR family transcriptional regulator [Roseiarcus sp.]|jgi:AcrR family transcriptional regulator